MRRGRPSARRQLTRDRVLLAVYLMADAQSLLCPAGRAAIARQAGVGVETANGYLLELVREGILAARPGGPGRPTLFVLMDHPESGALLASLDRAVRVP